LLRCGIYILSNPTGGLFFFSIAILSLLFKIKKCLNASLTLLGGSSVYSEEVNASFYPIYLWFRKLKSLENIDDSRYPKDPEY